MVALIVNVTMKALFGLLQYISHYLQIYMINYWNIKFANNLGLGLRVMTSQQSLTLTTLYFTYTQDRENHITIGG